MRTDEAEAYASTASTGEGGRNLPGTGAGAEVGTAAVGRTKPEAPRLMEAVVERSNMLCAYERVVKNQGRTGSRWTDGGRVQTMARVVLGERKTGAVGGRVYAGGGAQGGDTEAARRGTHGGHSDGVGPADPTSAASGAATAVRTRVFRIELRLSSRRQRAASGESRAGLRCRR